jgi:hypothetical protein
LTRLLIVGVAVAASTILAPNANADSDTYLDRINYRLNNMGVSESSNTLLKLGYEACSVAAGGGDTGDVRIAVEKAYAQPMPERMSSEIALTALAFLCPEYGNLLGR